MGRAAHVPAALGGGTDSVGIRAPSHAVARALLAALGEPIAAPSANRFQAISPTTAAHVLGSLGDAVDLVLDGGPCSRGLESTVLDVRGDVPTILRPGSIDREAIAAIEPRVIHAPTSTVEDDAARASPGMAARHYAPRAPLVLVGSVAEAADRARAAALSGSAKVGVVLREGAALPPADAVVERRLPADPEGYGRALYATLHELDAAGVSLIVVVEPPRGEAWRAVADRLGRASAGGP